MKITYFWAGDANYSEYAAASTLKISEVAIHANIAVNDGDNTRGFIVDASPTD